MKDFYALTELGRARRLRRLVDRALESYDLDIVRVRLLSNGFNGVFRLDAADGCKYVMRIGLPEPAYLAQYRAEIAWLKHLGETTDLLIPAPVRTCDGGYIVTEMVGSVPEPRHCMIFNWVPGRDLDEVLTPDNMALLGELSARLHVSAIGVDLPDHDVLRYDEVFFYPEPLLLFEEQNAPLMPPKRRRVFEEAIDVVQAAIDRLKASGEPPRLLHGDLHQWNTKIYRGRAGAIDFEDVVWGWPVQDVATTLYYFVSRDDYDVLFAAFRQGYEAQAPWPVAIPGEIQIFKAGRVLTLANYVIQDLSPEWRERAPEILETWQGRLEDLLSEIRIQQ